MYQFHALANKKRRVV